MHDVARGAIVFAVCACAAAGAWALARRLDEGQGVDVPEGDDAEIALSPGDFTFPLAAIADALEGAVTGDQLRMSDAGISMLSDFEGFSATPYSDFKGYSIGYGHLMKAGEWWDTITEGDALGLLAQDVANAERAVRACVKVPLTQSQFDALVSLAYNIGVGAFAASTLVRMLNAGDYAGAAAQFARWDHAGGVVNAALTARRASERQYFEG